jgi:Zn-dependent metalloprotease
MAEVEEEEKNIALKTLLIDTRMRERRSIIGSMSAMFPVAGEKDICIHDAHNTRDVRTSTRARCIGDKESNDIAVNEAYDGFDATYDLYKTVYGRKSIDDNNFPLKGYVHWGLNYVNAFWDGVKMCFGDGNPADKADWLIGQGMFTDINKALRSMKAPGTARPNDPQPAHMRDYKNLPNDEDNDNGGVHINSGIPNKAFYTTAVEIGGYAWEKAGLIWYKTLGSGLHTDCSFQEFAEHTFVEAGNLFGVGKSEQNAVRKGWHEVGIEV